MLILGIDASGKTASAALTEDQVVLAEYSTNIGLTHSQTLLPMVAEIFSRTGRTPRELGLIAVSAGPGSFTGLRIGAATGKGLALAWDIPMVEISTLESLAYNVSGIPFSVHPIMDARRQQVYTAEYRQGRLVGAEEAVGIEALVRRLNAQGGQHYFLGDGVSVYREYIDAHLETEHDYAPPQNLLQRASSAALLGFRKYGEGKAHAGSSFSLSYVRKPQAEREREAEGLREFDIVHESPEETGMEKTPDKLQAVNYVIGEGTGYENESETSAL